MWAPAAPGRGAARGAEPRLPGGKPEPGSTRDAGGWIRPFQPDESSTESRDGCRGGEGRGLHGGSSMAHTRPLQPL